MDWSSACHFRDHFGLFDLPVRFELDQAALDGAYRTVQAQVHPDRFAAQSAASKRLAMQWATRVNDAYQTLQNPLRRARYMLALRGVEVGEESNTAMEGAFLMRQMEWRERIEDAAAARDGGELETVLTGLRGERQERLQKLAALLDSGADQAAADVVRQLMFIERVASEAETQIDKLDQV